jgi:hypothetical protein
MVRASAPDAVGADEPETEGDGREDVQLSKEEQRKMLASALSAIVEATMPGTVLVSVG